MNSIGLRSLSPKLFTESLGAKRICHYSSFTNNSPYSKFPQYRFCTPLNTRNIYPIHILQYLENQKKAKQIPCQKQEALSATLMGAAIGGTAASSSTLSQHINMQPQTEDASTQPSSANENQKQQSRGTRSELTTQEDPDCEYFHEAGFTNSLRRDLSTNHERIAIQQSLESTVDPIESAADTTIETTGKLTESAANAAGEAVSAAGETVASIAESATSAAGEAASAAGETIASIAESAASAAGEAASAAGEAVANVAESAASAAGEAANAAGETVASIAESAASAAGEAVSAAGEAVASVAESAATTVGETVGSLFEGIMEEPVIAVAATAVVVTGVFLAVYGPGAVAGAAAKGAWWLGAKAANGAWWLGTKAVGAITQTAFSSFRA